MSKNTIFVFFLRLLFIAAVYLPVHWTNDTSWAIWPISVGVNFIFFAVWFIITLGFIGLWLAEYLDHNSNKIISKAIKQASDRIYHEGKVKGNYMYTDARGNFVSRSLDEIRTEKQNDAESTRDKTNE